MHARLPGCALLSTCLVEACTLWLRGTAFPRAGPCPLLLSARKQGEARCHPPCGLSQQPSGRSVPPAVLARGRAGRGSTGKPGSLHTGAFSALDPGCPGPPGKPGEAASLWRPEGARDSGQRAGGRKTRPHGGSRRPTAEVIGRHPRALQDLFSVRFSCEQTTKPLVLRGGPGRTVPTEGRGLDAGPISAAK